MQGNYRFFGAAALGVDMGQPYSWSVQHLRLHIILSTFESAQLGRAFCTAAVCHEYFSPAPVVEPPGQLLGLVS